MNKRFCKRLFHKRNTVLLFMIKFLYSGKVSIQLYSSKTCFVVKTSIVVHLVLRAALYRNKIFTQLLFMSKFHFVGRQ